MNSKLAKQEAEGMKVTSDCSSDWDLKALYRHNSKIMFALSSILERLEKLEEERLVKEELV